MTADTAATSAHLVEQAMVNIAGHDINIYGAFLAVLFIVFCIALYRAQKAQRLDWLDMLTRDGTKVSTTKVLQLVGGVVGTWIVVKVTLQGVLTWDIFAIYLGYVASVDGFSKLIMAKYGAQGSDDSRMPYRRNTYDQSGYQQNTGMYPARPTPPIPAIKPQEQNASLDEHASRGAAKAGSDDE